MPNRAIVLGLDRYATDLSSLNGPVADAQAMAEWLVTSNEVDPSHLWLGVLPGDDSPPMPAALAACKTVGTSIDALEDLLDELVKLPPGDSNRLYFFFSGHGATSSNPAYAEEALCFEGFADGQWRKALALSSLLGMLDEIPAKERFILIDGCRDAVWTDTARFNTLSRWARANPEDRRNYVLRATGPGRKAAEVDGRGLFARHLCEGLRGVDSAKRWDPTAENGNGAYVVRWNALCEYVLRMVAQLPAAQRHKQLVYEGGEHPAGESPLLASYPVTDFEPSTLSVRLVDPAHPPCPITVFLRRNDSNDPDLSQVLLSDSEVQFEVTPSVWVLWAQAKGWRSQPKVKPVPVYAQTVLEDIVLKPESGPPSPSAVLEDIGTVLGDLAPSTATAHESTDEAAAVEDVGRLHIRVGGRSVPSMLPSVRVAVRKDSGTSVVDPVMENILALPCGFYLVRLDVAGAPASETPVLVTRDKLVTLHLDLPDTFTPALSRMLELSTDRPSADGYATPSEALGPLAGTTIVTLAVLACAQAVQGHQSRLAVYKIGRRWRARSIIGVEVLVADERERTDAQDGILRVRFRGLFGRGSRPVGLDQVHFAAPIRSAGVRIDVGARWLSFNAPRSGGPSLATTVLPNHVTIVVQHWTASGALAWFQFAVPRDPQDRVDNARGLVQAEAFQRSRATGRDPLVDPGVQGLIERTWFEPMSALVAAAALLDRGQSGADGFERLVMILAEHETRGADFVVLQAASATRAGNDELAASLIWEAVLARQTPIVDTLLVRLSAEARRLEIEAEERKWIEACVARTVGHPLWTMIRDERERE